VPQPKTSGEKFRILFRNKSRRRGDLFNVHFDPLPTRRLRFIAEPSETFVVKVATRKDRCYWFSDRRIVEENGEEIVEPARYDAIRRVYWMFSDLVEHLKVAGSTDEVSIMKATHFESY